MEDILLLKEEQPEALQESYKSQRKDIALD